MRPAAEEDRIRSLLLILTLPLWGPWALLYGLCRLCGDGLLFVLEGYGIQLQLRSPILRLPFYLVSLPTFPIIITIETAISFLVFLGTAPLAFLGRRPPPALAVFLGLVVFLLSWIWFPLLALGWTVVVLVPGLGGATLDQLRNSIASLTSGQPQRVRGRFETFVALRYMRGKKAVAGVNVVTGLTIAGVTLGVWTLIVVLSVMAGFEADLQDKILGANSHIVVLSYNDEIPDWEQVRDAVAAIDGIDGVTPFIYSEFMLRSRKARIGAIFKGIDPETVGDATNLLNNIKLGPQGVVATREEALALVRDLDGRPATEDGQEARLPGILIGQEMQAALQVTVGDVIQAVSPLSEPGPMGSMNARIVELEVRGIFHSGMYEYDTKFSYSNLATAQDFMKMGSSVTGLEVTVHDIYEAPELASKIGARLQYPFWTRDWQKMNEPLFAALKLEKLVMGIILTFIVAVASMNIISTLIMLVIEKRREIAIMKAMGASRFDLMKLFMIDGLLVGFIGTILGLCGGLATCFALARWQFIELESDVYYVDTLPVHISAGLVIAVGLIAMGISFIATLFPAWEGSSLDPVEGLRDA